MAQVHNVVIHGLNVQLRMLSADADRVQLNIFVTTHEQGTYYILCLCVFPLELAF